MCGCIESVFGIAPKRQPQRSVVGIAPKRQPRRRLLFSVRRVNALLPGVLACCALGGNVVEAYSDPTKFIIVSNGASGALTYGRLPDEGGSALIPKLHTLVPASSSLVHPQGIAVDQKRRLLLVADSGLKKVVSYGLTVSGDNLKVDEQTPVAENVESRWVTVDGSGNVFYSDEQNNKIMKVSSEDVNDGITNSSVVLDPGTISGLSAPGGVATDNFYLYWTNKISGTEAGTVVRALQDGGAEGVAVKETPLAKNSPKSYGVCLALNNVFYTDSESKVWGVPKTGGDPALINSSMTSPRGCVWDQRETVYIADRSANGIFAFSTAFSLGEAKVTKVADLDEAFGIAVFSASVTNAHSLASLLVLLLFTYLLVD